MDEAGTVWLDAYGIKAQNSGPCIICGRQTNRVDINLMSFFCNTLACNQDSRTLALRNGYNGEYDEDRWTNEGGSVR